MFKVNMKIFQIIIFLLVAKIFRSYSVLLSSFTVTFILKEKDQKQLNPNQNESFLKPNFLVQISCKSDYEQESY